jgi:hypothetical protein
MITLTTSRNLIGGQMTVKELIEILHRYDGQMEVLLHTDANITHNFKLTRVEDVGNPFVGDDESPSYLRHYNAVCLVGDERV